MKSFQDWQSEMAGKYKDGSEIKPFAVRESRTPLQIRYDFAILEFGVPEFAHSVVVWLSIFSGRKSIEEVLGIAEDLKWMDAEDNILYWEELRYKILKGWMPNDLPEDD